MARSAVVRQAERNRAAAGLAEFTELLTAALELPEIRRAISQACETHRAAARSPSRFVTSAAAARDLKATRIAARGSRG